MGSRSPPRSGHLRLRRRLRPRPSSSAPSPRRSRWGSPIAQRCCEPRTGPRASREGARVTSAARKRGSRPEPARAPNACCSRRCARAHLPEPETNVKVGRWTVDFLWREAGLAVEVDAYSTHSSPWAFERDRRKDAELTASGSSCSDSAPTPCATTVTLSSPGSRPSSACSLNRTKATAWVIWGRLGADGLDQAVNRGSLLWWPTGRPANRGPQGGGARADRRRGAGAGRPRRLRRGPGDRGRRSAPGSRPAPSTATSPPRPSCSPRSSATPRSARSTR